MSKRQRTKSPICLCAMPFGFGNETKPGHYLTCLSKHDTVPEALAWGKRSGLSAGWSTDYMREGQLWIESADMPATLHKVWNR